MKQSARPDRRGRRRSFVIAAVVRGVVPVPPLCALAACSGAGASRGGADSASAGTGAARAASRQMLVRPGMAHGTALLSDPVVRQAVPRLSRQS